MPRLNPRNISRQSEGRSLNRDIRKHIRDNARQINNQTRVASAQNGIPSDLKLNDLTTSVVGTTMNLGISDSKGRVTNFPISRAITQYQGKLIVTTAPTTTELPQDGDYGWGINGTTVYWAINDAGTIRFPTLSTLSGAITDTQHGDRSTTTTTMHKFSQITGTITAAQHGALTTTTASHQNATTSDAGFMSSTDKTKLDNATDAATASRLAIRNGSGNCNFAIVTGTQFNVGSTKVVGAQGAAIADVAGTANAAYDATEQDMLNDLKTAVNATLARLRAHGLIDT